jgi:DivIVA domain-containing protein
VDQDVVDRIRSASFALARKGYEKREVDRFLDELADWLETGGDDTARSDLVRRELERIGEQTTAILTEAHDAAETMHTGAERQVRQQLADANIKADAMRSSAEEYAEEVREEADSYARRARAEADAATERARIEVESALESSRGDAEAAASRIVTEAEEKARETLAEAERRARQLVEEAQRRRADLESVISDLDQRREAVLGQLRRLASEVAGAAGGIGESPTEAPQRADSTEAEEASAPEDERTKPMAVREPASGFGQPARDAD